MAHPSPSAALLANEGLDPTRLPRHIAIIMDGNGRWAKARGLPRVAGHEAGVETVRRTVRACAELGIKALTLFAFSTENWLRPKSEVSELMKLLSWALRRETLELDRNNVRLKTIGRIDALPSDVQKNIHEACRALADNTGLTLALALNYGARAEIVDAVNRFWAEHPEGPLTEEALAAHLYTQGLPDPDLVIRTSGEMRVSNFLLWQIAYSELYVSPLCWPDFDRKALVEAIRDYQGRNRRFGGL
jgi:undecaprenyl diphosphate synthase